MSTTDDNKKNSKKKGTSKSKPTSRKSAPKKSSTKATSKKTKATKVKKPATTKKKVSRSKAKEPAPEAAAQSVESPVDRPTVSAQDGKGTDSLSTPLPPDAGSTNGADGAATDEIRETELISFELAGQKYGLPVENVVEVIRMVAVTELPSMPAGMLGVINLRGEVTPLLDLRQVFDLPQQQLGLDIPILVARANGKPFAMVVDAVDGIRTLSEDTQTASQALSTDVQYLSVVARLEEELLLVINPEALLSRFPSTQMQRPDPA
jgi:purine-binding chemotaxis protein CheW